MPEPATIARYRAATATAAAALPRLPTGTPDPYRAPEDATPSVSGLDHIRWPSVSTVQLVAVLKGQSPPGAFDVAHLGTLRSDCSGGPRLLEGDRVVLLFREGYPLGSSGDAGLGLLWSGALVLRDGAALYRQFGVSIPAGDAVDAVQEIALRAGAPADQRERAVRFAQGIDPGAARGTPLSPQAVAAPAGATPPARGSAGERAAWPAFSEVGLLALALSGGTTALVLLFRRRLHSP